MRPNEPEVVALRRQVAKKEVVGGVIFLACGLAFFVAGVLLRWRVMKLFPLGMAMLVSAAKLLTSGVRGLRNQHWDCL